jgi:hypothetical protein
MVTIRSESGEIGAALIRASVAGTRRLQEIAVETLHIAGVAPGGDPRPLGLGLRYRMRPVIVRPVRATAPRVRVEGNRIAYRYDDEWALNALIGIADVRIAELGIVAGRADRFRLAGHLAMPDPSSELEHDLATVCLPAWFVRAQHEARASIAAASTLRLVVAR